jgi:hypothetical protein
LKRVFSERKIFSRRFIGGSIPRGCGRTDVNLHQSTNDVYPTAVKIAAILLLRNLSQAIAKVQGAFQKKEKEFAKIVKIFDRLDAIVLLVEPNVWRDYESRILEEARKREIPAIIVLNKLDLENPAEEFIEAVRKKSERVLLCSSTDYDHLHDFFNSLSQEQGRLDRDGQRSCGHQHSKDS